MEHRDRGILIKSFYLSEEIDDVYAGSDGAALGYISYERQEAKNDPVCPHGRESQSG